MKDYSSTDPKKMNEGIEKMIKRWRKVLKGKTVVIAGGSKGIGKETSRILVQSGMNICMIARSKEALDNIKEELLQEKIEETQYIETIAADTTNMEMLKPLLEDFAQKHRVDYLLNFVGYAYPQYLDKLTLKDFRDCMEVNYFGHLIPILIMLPFFRKQKSGYIASCSSVMGFMGLLGYASYSPTKYAIVGLIESLRHELKDENIHFSVIYPPDTQTPGYENENKSKPEELKIISQGGGLLSPEKVAYKFVRGIVKRKFYIHPGESNLLWTVVRHFPKLSHYLLDRALTKAKRKMNKKR